MAGIKASESGDLAPVNNVASPMRARVPGIISTRTDVNVNDQEDEEDRFFDRCYR